MRGKKKEIFLDKVIVVTTPDVSDSVIEKYFGVVISSASPSKNIFRDAVASVRSLFGREVRESVRMMDDAGAKALERLAEKTVLLGGNAIINMRYATASIMKGTAELVAYGTAVKIKPKSVI